MVTHAICDLCGKAASSLYLEYDLWICRHCMNYGAPAVVAMVATEYLTPGVPNASPGHLRDIEDRRWHPTEKRMFYYSKEKPKSYFFPKG